MNNQALNKKDYLIVAVIGLFIGILALPVLGNLKIAALVINPASFFLLVVGCAVFAIISLWAAWLVDHIIHGILQFAEFAAIGALNTLLDLGVLNFLIFATAIAAGYWYSVFKSISFTTAVISSYYLNRYWTFKVKEEASLKEFAPFLVVSIVGFLINVGVASLIVNFVSHPSSISPERWANVGALTATIASLIWNFAGYKFVVFKR